MAPECCNPDIKEYSGIKADIWALGVTLYAFIFDALPFNGENEQEICNNVINSPLEFPNTRGVPDDLQNLISHMLVKDPSGRCTTEELKKSAWLNDGFHYTLEQPECQTGILAHFETGESGEYSSKAIEYAQKLIDQMQTDFRINSGRE